MRQQPIAKTFDFSSARSHLAGMFFSHSTTIAWPTRTEVARASYRSALQLESNSTIM